jgi:hypothetical protein
VTSKGTEQGAFIEIPAEIELWKSTDAGRVAKVQERIRGEFLDWFAKGYAAVGVKKTGAGAAYVMAPWSDF